MFEEKQVTWRRRIWRALIQLVINVIFWVVIPTLLYGQFSQITQSAHLPVSLDFIYAFGATITALQVLGALTEGMALSVVFISGSYITSAYYFWSALDGGNFAVATNGLNLTLSFEPLLFLIILPSLFWAIRAPLTYLTDQSEASRASPSVA